MITQILVLVRQFLATTQIEGYTRWCAVRQQWLKQKYKHKKKNLHVNPTSVLQVLSDPDLEFEKPVPLSELVHILNEVNWGEEEIDEEDAKYSTSSVCGEIMCVVL